MQSIQCTVDETLSMEFWVCPYLYIKSRNKTNKKVETNSRMFSLGVSMSLLFIYQYFGIKLIKNFKIHENIIYWNLDMSYILHILSCCRWHKKDAKNTFHVKRCSSQWSLRNKTLENYASATLPLQEKTKLINKT